MRALAGLQGAWRLALGQPAGLALLAAGEDEAAGTAASFWAIALCAPLVTVLHALDWSQSGAPPDAGLGLLRDLLGVAVGWLAFVVLMHRVCRRIGLGGRWPRFIIAWNWCNVVQYLMLLAASLPAVLGAPDWLSETLWLVCVGWALWLEWFATRLTLGLSGGMAAAVVGLDLALGMFVGGVLGG